MTLLLIPTTLFAFLILTSVVAGIAKQPQPVSLPSFSRSLPNSSAGHASEHITPQLDTQLIQISVTERPIKVRLRWRSDSMDSKREEMSRLAGMPPPPIPSSLQDQSQFSEMPPPPPPPPSRNLSQDQSLTQTTSRSMKRFSVQLPLQSTRNVTEILSLPAVTSLQSLSPLPTPPTSDRSATPEANDFLTALAAQERRVLELKEELEKAEADLTKLKKQWAVHEATKKRNELRHAEPLRPLKSPKNKESASPLRAGSSKTVEEEHVKRALSVKTKQSQRTVFEGRHTRTLSLLSPTSLAHRGNSQSSTDELVKEEKSRTPKTAIPTISNAPTADDAQQPKGARDDIVHTGRQLVGDLRDGLWTFIEDLRSVTVGDEAFTAARSRQLESALGATPGRSGNKSKDYRTPNKSSMPPRKKASKGESGAETLAKVSPTTALPLRRSSLKAGENPEMKDIMKGKTKYDALAESSKIAGTEDDDEGWSNWDSPPSKDAASNFSTTALSTPRSSLSEDVAKEKRRSGIIDQIPWPALQKVSPSNLTRTASNLMMEWEKSLNDPLAEQSSNKGQAGM